MSQTNSPPPAVTPRRFHWRRLFQHRLRTLLIFIVCLLTVAGTLLIRTIVDQQREEQEREQEALDSLMKEGVMVCNGDTIRFTRIPTHEQLQNCGRVPSFCQLIFENVPLRDAHLEQLQDLTHVRRLDLRGTQVTDAGLAYLRGLTHLKVLELNNTQITDAGLLKLVGLNELKILWLDHTKVSDAGMAHIKDLEKLSYLTINSTSVSDAGLRQLHAATRLTILEALNTKITEAAAKEFRSLFPSCELHVGTTRSWKDPKPLLVVLESGPWSPEGPPALYFALYDDRTAILCQQIAGRNRKYVSRLLPVEEFNPLLAVVRADDAFFNLERVIDLTPDTWDAVQTGVFAWKEDRRHAVWFNGLSPFVPDDASPDVVQDRNDVLARSQPLAAILTAVGKLDMRDARPFVPARIEVLLTKAPPTQPDLVQEIDEISRAKRCRPPHEQYGDVELVATLEGKHEARLAGILKRSGRVRIGDDTYRASVRQVFPAEKTWQAEFAAVVDPYP